jgi:hypothetical protein
MYGASLVSSVSVLADHYQIRMIATRPVLVATHALAGSVNAGADDVEIYCLDLCAPDDGVCCQNIVVEYLVVHCQSSCAWNDVVVGETVCLQERAVDENVCTPFSVQRGLAGPFLHHCVDVCGW